jgi:hypothetical protein
MADEIGSLRKSLQCNAKLAVETALRDGGDIPPERLETLRRLQTLIDIAEAVHGPPARNWLPAIALITSLAVASVLLFIHIPGAEVNLDASVSGLSFVMESDGPLFPGMNVSDLRVSGPQTVELLNLSPPAHPRVASSSIVSRIRLTVRNPARGSITLSSFPVPKTTQVRLEASDIPNRYRVTLQTPPGASTGIHLSCLGEIGVIMSASTPGRYRFDFPEPITSQWAPGQEIAVDLSFPPGGEIVLNPQLPVSHLSFQHVEQNLNRSGARYVSTIASGALFIESLNGIKRSLRSGDALQFTSSTGEMRRLSLHGGTIHAQFQGKVQGMTSGVENTPVNLMPSLLEWLRARHGLYLMWGTTLYLFGLLGAGWRWFRGVR